MSKLNKFVTTIIVILMLYPSFAQNNELSLEIKSETQIIEIAIKNYKKALESKNLGMIESAILNTMNIKFHHPDYDYSSLIEPLELLETNDKSKSIRFMSYIVKNYLLYPERYTWMDKIYYEFDKDFYTVIAEKVYEQLDN